jgi:hypothetical protein
MSPKSGAVTSGLTKRPHILPIGERCPGRHPNISLAYSQKQITKVKNYYMRHRPCPKCSVKKDDGKERKITEDEGGDCLNGNGHEMEEDSKNR